MEADDTGIDLVAKLRDDGGFCAIQCKFYAAEHHIQKAHHGLRHGEDLHRAQDR